MNNVDQETLPSIDDTIVAISVVGRIVDELRARLIKAEASVSRLEAEKLALKDELFVIVSRATRNTVEHRELHGISPAETGATRSIKASAAQQPNKIPSREQSTDTLGLALSRLIAEIDASFSGPHTRH